MTSPSTSSESNTEQGLIWADFIQGQLDREHERRSSLDTKGLAVVTSSGTLVTLIFAVGALAIGRKDINFVPNASVGIPAVIGLALFILAAVLGLLATRLIDYAVADKSSLELMRTTHWKKPAVWARNIVLWYEIDTLDELRRGNRRKATLVKFSLVTQVGATLALAISITLALLSI